MYTTKRGRSLENLYAFTIIAPFQGRVQLELEQGRKLALSHDTEDELAVNEPITRYYPSPIIGKACELFERLDRTVQHTSFE